MSTKKIYQIGKVRKLIDLNGDSTNFDVSFRVVTKNREPFDLLVVDQTTLDNTQNLEYQNVKNGEISGNVINDKNIFQNYYIILKCEKETECEVELDKKELPKTAIMPAKQSEPIKNNLSTSGWFSGTWKKIGIFITILLFAIFIYFIFFRKSDTEFNLRSPSAKSYNSPSISNGVLDKLKNLDV